MQLLKEITQLNSLACNSPLHKLQLPYGNLYAKLEYTNFMGSIKDRPAFYILTNAIKDNLIDEDSVVVESTSGNFGIALAGICRKLRIKFIPVIDPNITTEKENLLQFLSYDVIKVKEKDATGGYLLTRIDTVQQFLRENPGSYNPNQYTNEDNYLSYYHTLGKELCDSFSRLDYAFMAVSSGGTITGTALRLKEKFPDVKIIAVDVKGSLIFDNKPQERRISGLGASMRSPILDLAPIDDVMILSQMEIVRGCNNLLNEHGIFAGGSGGAAYYAAASYLKKLNKSNVNAMFICPDKGLAYLDNIYNKEWVNTYIKEKELSVV
ncbi:MAG: pyridoxal-phosphate dependent enzyme [Chitinophagaceae bacterium]